MQFVVIYWKYLPILSIKNSINDGNGVYLSCRFAVREVDAVFTLSEQDLLVLFKIKRLYLILSHIVDSLTFFARICDRCKFSSSRALELQRGGQDTIRTSWRNENPLIASSAVRSVLDADISAKNFCKCQGWVLMLVRSDVHSEITSSWHFVCSTRTGIRTSWAPRQYLELGQLAEEV